MRRDIVEQALGRGAERDADPAGVSASAASAVGLLLRELKPLVGELATVALYRRGVHLAQSSVQRPPDDAVTPDALLDSLRHDLAGRPTADVRESSRALLSALVDLLVSLIGESLTHRLLRKAWGVPADDGQVPEEKP